MSLYVVGMLQRKQHRIDHTDLAGCVGCALTYGDGYYFRIVRTDPPTLWDFTSGSEKKEPLRRPSPRAEELHRGISVYNTLGRALTKAQRFPKLGALVAEIDLGESEIPCERRSTSAGHYTIWAEPEILMKGSHALCQSEV